MHFDQRASPSLPSETTKFTFFTSSYTALYSSRKKPYQIDTWNHESPLVQERIQQRASRSCKMLLVWLWLPYVRVAGEKSGGTISQRSKRSRWRYSSKAGAVSHSLEPTAEQVAWHPLPATEMLSDVTIQESVCEQQVTCTSNSTIAGAEIVNRCWSFKGKHIGLS